jgi:aminopeptidase N
MLATHFEAADARRFLPSWDEPARKAAFALTAITPAGQIAVSNMPEMTAEVLPDGSRRTRFQETPRMSSYLLFLGIGDLERRETVVDGTVLGVVTKRGDVEKARFALDSAADLLRFYNAYFGAPYPLPKLDMVAVPGSAGFSAMENWGAILHFEQAMLIDPQLSTEANRQGVFTIVAHEIAHQWFGNLVTMEWWDDLWLNEGFASWMETKATDHFHPEWRVWLKSEAGRQRAMRQDSMRTTHPIVQPVLSAQQATQAFDSITYNKGQAVVRMLEGHVGEDAFPEGVRAYMRKFSYANAETAEFWDELEAAAPDRQVREIARDFTEQPGVPLIAARTGSCVDGRTPLSLRQQRFGVDQDSLRPLTWSTPVSAHAVGSGEGATRLLVRGPESLPVMLGSCAPVKVNAGQTAYFRTSYARADFDALAARFGDLDPADQLGLMYDSLALGQAGAAPMENFLRLPQNLAPDDDPVVWGQLAGMLGEVDQLYVGLADRRNEFRAAARSLLAPAFAALGWDPKPTEPANSTALRETLIDRLGWLDDPFIVAEARRRFEAFLRDPSSLTGSIRQPTLQVVARKADAQTYESLLGLARNAPSALEKQQLYRVLASAEDAVLARRSLEIAVSSEASGTTGLATVRQVAIDNPDLAWRFSLEHKGVLDAKLSSFQRHSFYPSIAAYSAAPERLTELRAFIDANVPPDLRQSAERTFAEMAYKLKVRAERLPEVDRWLADRR